MILAVVVETLVDVEVLQGQALQVQPPATAAVVVSLQEAARVVARVQAVAAVAAAAAAMQHHGRWRSENVMRRPHHQHH